MIMEAGSPQICVVSRQGGDPGQPVVSLQSESKGLRTRNADDVSLNPRAKEN